MKELMETGWYWLRVPGETEGVLYWVHRHMCWGLALVGDGDYNVQLRKHVVGIMLGDWVGPIADPFAGKPNDR